MNLNYLANKSILVTGGTGSFGKAFTTILMKEYNPKKLIIFSRDELKQLEMSQRWHPQQYPCLRYFLGDVRDRKRIARALMGIDIVVHAAALKQVPAAEYNPMECVKTNIGGAENVVKEALSSNDLKVISLSTDNLLSNFLKEKICLPIYLLFL